MKKFINKTYDYFFAALLLLFPFSNSLPNIVIAILVTLFIIDYKRIDLTKLKNTPAILLYVFFAYIFSKAVITQSLFTEWNIYKKYIIILILPILFTKVKNVTLLKVSTVISIVATVIVSLALIAKYYFETSLLPFHDGEMVNKLLVLERPYAGFYAVAGVFISLGLIRSLPRYKIALIVNVLLLVFFIILIAARISFVSLIIALGLYVLFYYKISGLKKAGIILCSVIAIAVVFSINKNIAERFFIKSSLEEAIKASDFEARLVIWPCAYNMAQNNDFNVLFGYPSHAVIINNFVDCYTHTIKGNDSKKAYFIETKFNSHNQFIDSYLSSGSIGLILFLSFFISLFFKVRFSFCDVALLIALILFLLVENVLHRQTGCYIFSIFTALLLMRNTNVNDEN